MMETVSFHRRIGTWPAIAVLALAGLLTAVGTGGADEQIRESVLAGTWYPADPAVLTQQLDEFLNAVPTRWERTRLLALIAPHAGHAYSGRIAAHAYKLLQGRTFDTVVIIAPSHRVRFPGVSVYDVGGYRTPLGLVPIDLELIRELQAVDNQIRYRPEAHREEHAVEIQLPFLQRMLPTFKLVPLVMGEPSWDSCARLASSLARAIRGKSVLLVASSDLSHYHPAAAAHDLDQVVLDKVAKLQAAELNQALAAGKCEACGGGAIITTLLAARELGADRGEVLRYGHSGEVTGDSNAVVGYLAAAVWAAAAPTKPDATPAASNSVHLGLNPEEKTRLLTLARAAITAKSRSEPAPPLEPLTPKLKEPRGAFVTLHENGQLRGCIGHIVGRNPLAETVAQMALAAAFEDPRFPPIEPREVANLVIEISVLTPLERITKIEEIEVGRHGLFLQNGRRAGLLLPQVAVEQHWDRRTFIEETCRKAGLEADAWQDPSTEIHRFEAEIFSETSRP